MVDREVIMVVQIITSVGLIVISVTLFVVLHEMRKHGV
jgi:hypothetical protein